MIFFGGLNREIQTILEYKEYNTITRLFHLASKAEQEVHDHQPRTRPNFSTGRTSSWTPLPSDSATCGDAPTPRKFSAPPSRVPSAMPPPSTGPALTLSSFVASTGKTKDIPCCRFPSQVYYEACDDCARRRRV